MVRQVDAAEADEVVAAEAVAAVEDVEGEAAVAEDAVEVSRRYLPYLRIFEIRSKEPCATRAIERMGGMRAGRDCNW